MAKPFFVLLAFLATTWAVAVETSPMSQNLTTVHEDTYRSRATSEVNIGFQYSQSANVWQTVSDIKRAEGSLTAINNVVRKKHGVPEEAFAVFSVSINRSLSRNTQNRIYINSVAETLGFGLVQNPVIPELRASGIVVGMVNGGYITSIQRARIDLRLGAVGGMGREKRIDAISTDLIDKIPVRNGEVVLYGADLDLARRFEINTEYTISTDATFRPTVFETTTPHAVMDEEQEQAVATYRWKILSTFEKQLVISGLDKTFISVEAIAGPQPLPVVFLPRIWDYVHRLYPLPELGSMFGAGLHFSSALSHHTAIGSHVGFYGGYVGGDLLFRWKSITLAIASWGIETTSAYRVMGERFWHTSIGLLL